MAVKKVSKGFIYLLISFIILVIGAIIAYVYLCEKYEGEDRWIYIDKNCSESQLKDSLISKLGDDFGAKVYQLWSLRDDYIANNQGAYKIKSAIRMLKPSAGLQGIKDFIIETVEAAGPNPCPPMVVGVGIGVTFDKAALLAKKALMRPIDSSNPDPFYADLEVEMLEKINELGIGPQGFGGRTTAIGLNIETLPTHIAGMPCAVNINCHVTRHKSEVI